MIRREYVIGKKDVMKYINQIASFKHPTKCFLILCGPYYFYHLKNQIIKNKGVEEVCPPSRKKIQHMLIFPNKLQIIEKTARSMLLKY